MIVKPELKDQMIKCRDLFKEAYDLVRDITDQIEESIEDKEIDFFNIQDSVTNYLIDNEDVVGLIEVVETNSL